MSQVLRFVAIAIAVLALMCGAALLMRDAGVKALQTLPLSMISAGPLLLAGIAFLIAQPVIRPSGTDLCKNLLLAATFLLWGIVQLNPQTDLSARLGNVVILLYVVDLAWAIFASVSQKKRQFD